MTDKHKQYLWLDINWEDSWFSSHYLVKNLKRSYQEKLGTAFHTFSLPADEAHLKQFIKVNQITSVILADPRLNILFLIKLLSGMEFLIHVIGDPVRKLQDLKQMKLGNEKVCLLAGSQASFQILKNFCNGNVQFFPFMPEVSDLPSTPRAPVKNKFIYYGRISHKKNINALLELFSRYQKEINPEAELSIFGAACNANFPAKPLGHYIGMTADSFFYQLAELQAQGHKIHYHGAIARDELQILLPGYNTFVSLSTAAEEDFGLSLFEALEHGLSCVVTKWGGFREFQSFGQVSLIDVIHEEATLYLDQEQLFSALEKQNNTCKADFSVWMNERNRLIQELDLDFESRPLIINLEHHFFSEEFFNEHQKLVSPYWR